MAIKVVIAPSDLATPDFDVNGRVPGKVALPAKTPVLVEQNATTKAIEFTNADGTVTSIAQVVNDVHLDTAVLDAATNVMTLTTVNSDGTAANDITIDLAKLASVETDVGNGGVVLVGAGTTADKLKANLVIDPTSSTALTVSAMGAKLDSAALKAELCTETVTDMAGNVLFKACAA